jgi:hypothetical protein
VWVFHNDYGRYRAHQHANCAPRLVTVDHTAATAAAGDNGEGTTETGVGEAEASDDLDDARFTVLLNTFKRRDLLKRAVAHYAACPGVAAIRVAWSEQVPPPARGGADAADYYGPNPTTAGLPLCLKALHQITQLWRYKYCCTCQNHDQKTKLWRYEYVPDQMSYLQVPTLVRGAVRRASHNLHSEPLRGAGGPGHRGGLQRGRRCPHAVRRPGTGVPRVEGQPRRAGGVLPAHAPGAAGRVRVALHVERPRDVVGPREGGGGTRCTVQVTSLCVT